MRTLTPSQVNALLASAYNLHIGPVVLGAPLHPDGAEKLAKEERLSLARLLQEKGGSSLYSQADASTAIEMIEKE